MGGLEQRSDIAPFREQRGLGLGQHVVSEVREAVGSVHPLPPILALLIAIEGVPVGGPVIGTSLGTIIEVDPSAVAVNGEVEIVGGWAFLGVDGLPDIPEDLVQLHPLVRFEIPSPGGPFAGAAPTRWSRLFNIDSDDGAAAIADAAAALGGRVAVCCRVSSADSRERHRGISHHVHTALRLTCHRPEVPLPTGLAAGVDGAEPIDGPDAATVLAAADLAVTTMGRSPADDPDFFAAAASAGAWAAAALVPQSPA
jgi:hypothetical protein